MMHCVAICVAVPVALCYVAVKVVCVTGPQVCVLRCVAMRVAVRFALCCIQVKLVCVTGQKVFPGGPRCVFSFVHVGCCFSLVLLRRVTKSHQAGIGIV